MSALAFALALAGAPASAAPVPWAGGRIVTTRGLHVGVRPAVYVDNEARGGALEVGAGLTVQVRLELP